MKDSAVESFDSSSPVWRAFKDARNNYYADGEDYTAVRIPQSDKGLPMRRIREGRINQAVAVDAEREALEKLRAYGRRETDVEILLDALRCYDDLLGTGRKTRTPWQRIVRTLKDRPWERCPCRVCRELGIEVVLFRGANRNRRRGFHNLWFTQKKLETWREEATT